MLSSRKAQNEQLLMLLSLNFHKMCQVTTQMGQLLASPSPKDPHINGQTQPQSANNVNSIAHPASGNISQLLVINSFHYTEQTKNCPLSLDNLHAVE